VEDETLPTSDNTVEVSDDSVGRQPRRGRARAAANHHKNLPANLSAPDEEASPEVGQPKKASIELGKRNR